MDALRIIEFVLAVAGFVVSVVSLLLVLPVPRISPAGLRNAL